MNTSQLPVALFAYARPDHLRRCLDALRSNRVGLIYAFADGPRTPAHATPVAQVRQLLAAVDWCDLRLVARPTNIGLGANIRDGISTVLRGHPSVMVLEDDILLRPGAHRLAQEALATYNDNPAVMSLSLSTYPAIAAGMPPEGYFCPRFIPSGWVTTAEAWARFTGSVADMARNCRKRGLDLTAWGDDIVWQVRAARRRHLWYVGYVLTHWLHDGLSYIPTTPWAVNIGWDGSGENTNRSDRVAPHQALIPQPVCRPTPWPAVHCHAAAQALFQGYFRVKRRTPLQHLRHALGAWRRRLMPGS